MSEGVDELEKAMSLPLDIKSEYWKRFSARVLKLGCFVFTLLIAIAAIAPVREVAIAEGQLATRQPPVTIGHLEGGIVAEVFTRQGAVLDAGAPIARLSPLRAESDLEQINTRSAFLTLQIARIEAQLGRGPPDFGTAGQAFPGLARKQQALYDAEIAAYTAEIRAIDAEISERSLERDAASREVSSAISRIEIADQQAAMQRRLRASGFATQTALLDAEGALEDERSALASAQKAEIAAVRGIADAEARLASLKAERIAQWTVTLTELSAEAAELRKRLQHHQDQVARLLITTPVRGMVHEITAQSQGEIVAPGDQIATVIPLDDTLVAEVKVRPDDIGHIEVGYSAEITVTTFDKEVYGSLAGTVLLVSPTTFESPQEEPFYSVRLSIDRYTLSDGKTDFRLLPGMVVRAEILTGERSVLRYLLKPLVRAFDRAFIER